jgi:hypothetical protein
MAMAKKDKGNTYGIYIAQGTVDSVSLAGLTDNLLRLMQVDPEEASPEVKVAAICTVRTSIQVAQAGSAVTGNTIAVEAPRG